MKTNIISDRKNDKNTSEISDKQKLQQFIFEIPYKQVAITQFKNNGQHHSMYQKYNFKMFKTIL